MTQITESFPKLDKIITATNIPRISLCLYIDGVVYSIEGASDSVLTKGEIISENMVFQAASLSKPVFSYIVMRMVDKGEIDLDTPVCNYTDIERFADKEKAKKLTPRMILRHTSGLYNWATSPTSKEWNSSQIKFHYPPDSCFSYSGEAYSFLQRAVEAIRGKSLNEIAKEEVFIPLKMPLTSYQWIPEYDTLALNGFDASGKNMGKMESAEPNCAYTLRTTHRDYINFLHYAVLRGKYLSKKTHKEWLRPEVHAKRYANENRESDLLMYWCMGMGVKVKENWWGKKYPLQYWHWGDNGDFKALYVVEPSTKKILVYFTNSQKGHYFADEFCRLLMGEDYGIQGWIDERDDD